MSNPSKLTKLKPEHFPGSGREVAARAGIGRMTAHRHLPTVAHIGWWRRSKKGNPTAIWEWGPGEDAPCDVEPLPKLVTSRTYRLRLSRANAPKIYRRGD